MPINAHLSVIDRCNILNLIRQNILRFTSFYNRVAAISLIFLFCVAAFSQITDQTSSGRNYKRPELAEQAEARIRQVTGDSGRFFKQGLFHLQNNRRSEAREDFDEAVTVFLRSGVDVQRNQVMRECYSQLIETIYRMEFPSNQQPANIRSLSATCGWNIDNKLADEIASLVISQPNEPSKTDDKALVTAAGVNNIPADKLKVGFSEQKFTILPSDELAKYDFKEKNVFEKNKPAYSRPAPIPSPGAKPKQKSDGTIPAVIKYIYENFNDPYSVRYVSWSELIPVYLRGQSYWQVIVKLRAKNLYNAYVLKQLRFLIRNETVSVALDESIPLPPILDIRKEKIQDQELTVQPPVLPQTVIPPAVGVRIVKAQTGDTVDSLAKRNGANPIEVAKINGLLPTSYLNAGREIRIPIK